jgi:hypothetical protein
MRTHNEMSSLLHERRLKRTSRTITLGKLYFRIKDVAVFDTLRPITVGLNSVTKQEIKFYYHFSLSDPSN